MIIKQELVKKVKDYFNLNIYETKVWLALLSKGVISAGETAELSGVPRSRTYDVLESLAKRGFAVIKIGKPVKYIAVDPKTVIEKIKSNVLQEANDRVTSLSGLKDTPEYSELYGIYKSGINPIKAEDISGLIKGRPNIVSRIREVMESAQKELTIHTSIGDFEDKLRVILPTIEKLEASNVKIKVVLYGEEDKIRKMSSKYGIKAKSTQNTGRFFVADKKEAFFMINPENAEEEVGIWINTPFFAQSLSGMFDLSSKK